MSTRPERWWLLHSPPADSASNMALDEALLLAMPRLQRAVLRFYSWTEPAASFGYFQKFGDVERLTPLRPLVRRPTAGGIVPHDADWTYSIGIPASSHCYGLKAVESYRRVHEWIQAAFGELGLPVELAQQRLKTGPGQCFVGYDQFDVLYRGRKIAGAAQRRTREGLLIQGSVQPPPAGPSRADWEKAMCDTAYVRDAVVWQEFQPDPALLEATAELARRKYSQASYNQKR